MACHTLRKTFGYWLYIATDKDTALVRDALGQTDIYSTLRYIGINTEKVNQAVSGLSFKLDNGIKR